MTDGMSDQVLSRLVRAGDADAFGVLIERHMRRAYLHALGFVGSREDALDLSQEAFARAYRARHTLDPAQPFYGWLYQILRRLCFNFLRDARTRRRLMDVHAVDWIVLNRRAGGSDPALETERDELRRLVAEGLDRLPTLEREVLVLKEFEELKYREIADLIGVPIGTVMSRLYAARRRLAAMLETSR
jgi:RNA polymerase sigma-70 factor, ECF subfamily